MKGVRDQSDAVMAAYEQGVKDAADVLRSGFDRGLRSARDKCAHDRWGSEGCDQCAVDAIMRLILYR